MRVVVGLRLGRGAVGRCGGDTGPMRRVEADALVGASRDEVWELLDDIAGITRWLPGVRAISSISGPAHVGTTWRERSATFGIPSARTWEIAEHRRPARQVRVAVDGGMARDLVLTLEGRGTGTRLRAELELRSAVPWPLGLVHEMLATFPARWAVRSFVGAAKRVFEGTERR